MKLHHTAFALALIAAGIGSYPSQTHAISAAEIDDITVKVHNLTEAFRQYAQTPAGQVLGWAGARSTTTPVAVVIPNCRMKTDKWVYKVGDTVKITWSTENVTSGNIQVKDAANTSFDVVSLTSASREGTATWLATTAGLASITGSVHSSSNVDRTCLQSISIVNASTTLKDARIAGITAAITQKSAQIEKIHGDIDALTARLDKLTLEITALNDQITKIQQSTSTKMFEKKPVTASSTDSMIHSLENRSKTASSTSPVLLRKNADVLKQKPTTSTGN